MEPKGAPWGKASLRLQHKNFLSFLLQTISYGPFSGTLLGVAKTTNPTIFFVLEKFRTFLHKEVS